MWIKQRVTQISVVEHKAAAAKPKPQSGVVNTIKIYNRKRFNNNHLKMLTIQNLNRRESRIKENSANSSCKLLFSIRGKSWKKRVLVLRFTHGSIDHLYMMWIHYMEQVTCEDSPSRDDSPPYTCNCTHISLPQPRWLQYEFVTKISHTNLNSVSVYPHLALSSSDQTRFRGAQVIHTPRRQSQEKSLFNLLFFFAFLTTINHNNNNCKYSGAPTSKGRCRVQNEWIVVERLRCGCPVTQKHIIIICVAQISQQKMMIEINDIFVCLFTAMRVSVDEWMKWLSNLGHPVRMEWR